MAGEFDEGKHPRDEHGRFGSGGGASEGSAADAGDAGDLASRASASLADPAFIGEHGERLTEAADIARNYFPQSEHATDRVHNIAQAAIHAEAMLIHGEADANANEARAAAAGNINDLPREATEAAGQVQAIADESKQVIDGLHESGQAAVDVMADLHALSDEESGIGLDESYHEDLAGHYSHEGGKEVVVPEDDDTEQHDELHEPEEPDDTKPDPSDSEALADHEQAAKDYSEAKAEYDAKLKIRQDAFHAKANEAQTALEAHQEKQRAALRRIAELGKQYDKAWGRASDAIPGAEDLIADHLHVGHTMNEAGDFADPQEQQAYDQAFDAADNRTSRAHRQLDKIGESVDFGSRIDELKNSIAATKDALESLSEVTGRALIKPPKAPGKTKKSADFDESKHPRAKDGKFGSGGGGAGDGGAEAKHPLAREAEADPQGRAYRAAVAAHDHALRGTPDALPQYRVEPKSPEEAQAIGRQAYEAEHATIAEEAQAEVDLHAAVAAGHIDDAAPRAALEELTAAGESARSEISAVSEDLHASMDSAADAVAAFSAADSALSEYDADLEDLGIERHEVETADVVAGMEGASASLTADGDGKNYEDLSGNHKIDVDHIDMPDEGGDGVPTRDEYETDEDFAAGKEHWDQYKADVNEVHAEYLDRANKAQTALETLHEKQTSAIERTKAAGKLLAAAHEKATESVSELTDKPESLVNHKAFEGHDLVDATDEDGEETTEFSDPKVQEEYDRAHAVAEDLADRYYTAVEEEPDTGFNHEEIVSAIKDSARYTAATIKRLSKVTGRAPNIAPKKPKAAKKSANRPDDASTATVAVMARHKLRLSKLDFISLVDNPAQATATVRLIKRAGGGDAFRARATAKLVKVSDGTNPLAYFWAFTCTDETGAPYHDLQGDAIAPDAFVKAAEEFMASTAAVDEMHDGKQTSRVAFAFPMDSDIAAGMFGDAIGKQVKTSGLMVAIRPSASALVKLRSGAYTGVSIAGLGTREVAKAMPPWLGKDKKKPKPKRYGKQAVLTSESDGHVHSIDLDDPADCYSDHLSTSYQTSEGADQSHNHAWVFDAISGAITIAADSGHTHTVSAVVPADVIARAAADEDDDEDDCTPCGAGDKPSGAAVVVINARAPAGKSPPGDAAATVKSQEQSKMEIRKALSTILALSDSQRSHFATMTPEGAEEFLGKSAVERDAIVKSAVDSNPEVYKTAAGLVIRKSDGPVAEMLAKQADAQAAVVKAQTEQLAVEKAAREQVEIEKRAGTELSHFGKSLRIRSIILKGIALVPDATDAERAEAVESLKGANVAMVELGKARGTDGGGLDATESGSGAAADAQLKAAVQKFQSDNKLPSFEVALLKGTEADANIRKLYAAASAS